MNLLISEKYKTAVPFARYLGLTDTSHVSSEHGGKTGYITGTHDGETWVVTWCLGHLVNTCMPDEYDPKYKHWQLDDLPIIPSKWKYCPSYSGSARKQFGVIKKLFASGEVTTFYNAGDADREGCLIMDELLREFHAKDIPSKRLWYSALTDSAMPKIWENMKPASDYDNLGIAADMRQKLDWLYGINLTRAFTAYSHVTQNVGRVVSPTINLVVSRQNEIDTFVPKEYAIVKATLDKGQDSFVAKARYDDLDVAAGVKKRIVGKDANITNVESKDASTSRLLYDMTGLQADASKLFGYEPSDTMSIVQSLYESGWMTYPRTNSNTITPDDEAMTAPLPGLALTEMFGDTDTADVDALDVKRIVSSPQNGDIEDSHPGLCPTREGIYAYQGRIRSNDKQRNIFVLVTCRLISSCLPPHVSQKTKVEVNIDGEQFSASGSIERNPGFVTFEDYVLSHLSSKRKPSKRSDVVLPALTVGDIYEVSDASTETKKTEPPKPYTTATLLETMKTITKVLPEKDFKDIMKAQKAGLGTQSSRDAVIATIKKNGFVETRRGYLYPTDKAKRLMSLLPESIKSPALTAKMEMALSGIADGTVDPDKMMSRIVSTVTRQIDDVKKLPPLPDTARYADAKVIVQGGCPKCGGNIVDSNKVYACANGCGFVVFKRIAKKPISQKECRSLCENGVTTEKLQGLTSKKGKKFDCWIYVDDGYVTKFDFSDDGDIAHHNKVARDKAANIDADRRPDNKES